MHSADDREVEVIRVLGLFDLVVEGSAGRSRNRFSPAQYRPMTPDDPNRNAARTCSTLNNMFVACLFPVSKSALRVVSLVR